MKNLEKLSTNMYNDVLNGKTGNTYGFNGEPANMQKGYFVGVSGIQVPKRYFLNPKYPIYTLSVVLEEQPKNQIFDLIGFWVNNNIVYIDFVVYTEKLETALNLAKINNQKAIWDCSNQIEIYL